MYLIVIAVQYNDNCNGNLRTLIAGHLKVKNRCMCVCEVRGRGGGAVL